MSLAARVDILNNGSAENGTVGLNLVLEPYETKCIVVGAFPANEEDGP